jgi:hypothetical protein
MEAYANLELAAGSHDSELRAEIARLSAEHGTPAQLAGLSVAAENGSQVRTRDAAVAALAEIFPSDTRESLLTRLRSCYPDDQFQFSPLTRQTARELLKAADSRRVDYQRLILTKPLRLIYPHAEGIGADVSYLQAIEVGNRLIGLHVASLLETDRLQESLEALDAMFRASEWVAAEKHTLPRIAAARLRADALAATGAVARHPRTDAPTQAQLLELVKRQLANWPADADAWIGERAEGLHTYELVRDGYLLSVIPFEKLRQIREDLGVDNLGKVVSKNLDMDERFYLDAMRQIIEASSRPYYQRAVVFQGVEEALERVRSADTYPFVADQLLLIDLESRQQMIALDRARCVAWLVALTVAAGQEPPEGTANPMTGEPYSVIRAAGMVTVDGVGDGGSPIEVPDRAVAG